MGAIDEVSGFLKLLLVQEDVMVMLLDESVMLVEPSQAGYMARGEKRT